jgi:hypothetical protein
VSVDNAGELVRERLPPPQPSHPIYRGVGRESIQHFVRNARIKIKDDEQNKRITTETQRKQD